MSDLSSQIERSASTPRRAQGDAGSVEQHPLADQIAADRYLASKRAGRGRAVPIRIARVSPGGAV